MMNREQLANTTRQNETMGKHTVIKIDLKTVQLISFSKFTSYTRETVFLIKLTG